MKPRINVFAHGNRSLNALQVMGQAVNNSSVERQLLELMYFRVSQINGCAFCLDMHAKDLRVKGETEQRIYMLSAWRESPFYSDRERAALAWAEALTKIEHSLVAEHVFAEVKKNFSDVEIVDLTMAVNTINCYNRVNIAFGAEVGAYEPGMFEKVK